MRCRATSSAAHSLRPLWISDSLLSEAYHRFARVSHTQFQDRRHGSNVPGPMEARRRLSRRRMGMTTLERAGGGEVPGEEVGVLFGFGRRRGEPIGVEFAKGWTYQAPDAPAKLVLQRQLGQQKSPGLYWPMIGSDGSPWELKDQQISAKEDARVEEFFHVPDEFVEDTSASFDILLNTLTAKESLTDGDLEPIFQVLDTMVTIQGGHDFLRLVETLAPHTVSQQIWRRLAVHMKKKVANRNISKAELLTIFKLILDRTNHWEPVIFLFANRIVATNAETCLFEVLEYIVTTDQHKAKTKSWLQFIQAQSNRSVVGDMYGKSWHRLYGILANHFQPSDSHVVHHFGQLTGSELATVLLEYYLPRWLTEDGEKTSSHDTNLLVGVDKMMGETGSATEGSQAESQPFAIDLFSTQMQPAIIDFGTVKVIHRSLSAAHTDTAGSSSHSSFAASKARMFTSRLKSLKTQLKQQSNSRKHGAFGGDNAYTHPAAMFHLVDQLARYKIPYIPLLEEVTDVWMQIGKDKATKDFFMRLRGQKNFGIPTALAARLVHRLVQQNELESAFDIFRNIPTLPLLPYAELLLKLIQQGKTHGAYIFEMLNRFHPEEHIPQHWREHTRMSRKQEHVDLVHQVAYAFASSEHLSPRTAYRRVWECFRFLKDRRAPLQSQLSRAFVKAGISRPLNECERLSEKQVKYVISIVHQIEGPAIAKEVDHIVWDAWQWTLERQWTRNAAPSPKVTEDQGQFYANRRRLWMKGGGRVYSPFGMQEQANAGIELPPIDSKQDSGATEDMESNVTDSDPKTAQLADFEPMKSLSSLTEIHEVMGGLQFGPSTTDTYAERLNGETGVEKLGVSASEMDNAAVESCDMARPLLHAAREDSMTFRLVPHEGKWVAAEKVYTMRRDGRDTLAHRQLVQLAR